MRLGFALPALLVLAASPARAQQMLGSCSGTLQMTMGMDIATPDGANFTIVNTAQVPSVLDLAECQCNSQDLFVRGFVTTPLPINSTWTYQVWAGTSCDQQLSRNGTPPPCQQITNLTPTVSYTDYWVGSGNTPRQQIPVQALAAPNMKGMCSNINSSNSLYFLLFNNSVTPENVCSIPLPVHTVPPTAPTLTAAGSGDGAITLTWLDPQPGGTNIVPTFYQVLCSDLQGNPIPALQAQNQSQLGYSTCVNNKIQRRLLETGGATGPDTDGGVFTDDAGFPADYPVNADPPLQPANLQPSGMGVDAGFTPVDGGITSPDATVAFHSLDSKYVCSALLTPTTTYLRITGLTNNVTYQFSVVGIDLFGNPAPSAVLAGTPQPVEDLFRRLRDEGLAKQGFCFIATAAYGSYESPFVQVLREFRDRDLLTNSPGRAFVAWYYVHSPSAAAFITEHGTARFATQQALQPVILMALVATAPAWAQALLVTLLLGLALRRRFALALARSRA